METILESLAFAGFLAAQFLGVVAVHAARVTVDNLSSLRSEELASQAEFGSIEIFRSRSEARLAVGHKLAISAVNRSFAVRQKGDTDEGGSVGYDSRDVGGWRCNLGLLGQSGKRSTSAFSGGVERRLQPNVRFSTNDIHAERTLTCCPRRVLFCNDCGSQLVKSAKTIYCTGMVTLVPTFLGSDSAVTTLFPSLSLSVTNHLLFIVILSLVPMSIWAVWDLEHRWHSWLMRRQASHGGQRRPSKP